MTHLPSRPPGSKPLLLELGYRPPDPVEEKAAFAGRMRGRVGDILRSRRDAWIPAAVLDRDPLISYSGMVPNAPLGLADLLGGRLRHRVGWFLLSPTWSVDDAAAALRRVRAIRHRRRNRGHRLIFIGNTPEEVAVMQRHGEAAFLFNKTAAVSEAAFRPLPDIPQEFDAIYNAHLLPWKRHELTVEIGRCAFLCYRPYSTPEALAAEAAILARHRRIPGHVFINAFGEDGAPVALAAPAVNRALSSAKVALCLSDIEGPMFASAEYLLAGLPIVTTPSKGGRHIYHDPEYCWTVPADPRAVAEAVYALGAKGIPRVHIRERTLLRFARDRARFLDLIDAILEESGAGHRMERPWPFRKRVIMEWLREREAVGRSAHGVIDAFETPAPDAAPGGLRLRLRAVQQYWTGR